MANHTETSEKIKLRCFVAMAFNHADTDAVYMKHIEKAIIEANMIAVRVDRITHNERIDEKIRQEIIKADIIIADLTYARPSVYWEAGFAERVTPVIYTCRADHFMQAENDTFGNFIVHFDLKNANIETWNGVDDQSFQGNLRKRLNYVGKTIRVDKKALNAKKLARKNFSQIAMNEKRTLVSNAISRIIEASGFINFPESIWRLMSPYRNRIVPIFYKRVDSTILIIYLYYCLDKLLKWQLSDPEFPGSKIFPNIAINWNSLPEEITKLSRRRIKAVKKISVIPVIGSVPSGRIEDVAPSWRWLELYNHYYCATLRKPRIWYGRDKEKVSLIASSQEVFILDKKLSLEEYEEAFYSFLSDTENDKRTIIPVKEQVIE
jgi:nucleoside 2-deoxyribosyltransferase